MALSETRSVIRGQARKDSLATNEIGSVSLTLASGLCVFYSVFG